MAFVIFRTFGLIFNTVQTHSLLTLQLLYDYTTHLLKSQQVSKEILSVIRKSQKQERVDRRAVTLAFGVLFFGNADFNLVLAERQIAERKLIAAAAEGFAVFVPNAKGACLAVDGHIVIPIHNSGYTCVYGQCAEMTVIMRIDRDGYFTANKLQFRIHMLCLCRKAGGEPDLFVTGFQYLQTG